MCELNFCGSAMASLVGLLRHLGEKNLSFFITARKTAGMLTRRGVVLMYAATLHPSRTLVTTCEAPAPTVREEAAIVAAYTSLTSETIPVAADPASGRGLTCNSIGLRIVATLFTGETLNLSAVFVPPLYATAELPSGWYVPHIPGARLSFVLVNVDHMLAQRAGGVSSRVNEQISAAVYVDGAAMLGDVTVLVPPENYVNCRPESNGSPIGKDVEPLTAHIVVDELGGHVQKRCYPESIVVAL